MSVRSEYILGGRYEILSRIGAGSFGVVYKVRRLSDDKIVAVKEIRMESFANNGPSISGEFSIFPHITHPHIATYYLQTCDEATNCYLIEMEYYSRGSLKSYIQEYRREKIIIPEEEIWRISSEVLTALDYLHSETKPDGTKGVILHRDIKPENILLTHDNQVKLSDFGTSRFLKPAAMAESIVGSPLFMAPEISFHKGYREPVDIWSLGCVLINMCTRMAPQVVDNKLYDQLRDIIPNIPDNYSNELSDFIASCLRIVPSHRPTVRQALRHPRVMAHVHNDNLIISLNFRPSIDHCPSQCTSLLGNSLENSCTLSDVYDDKQSRYINDSQHDLSVDQRSSINSRSSVAAGLTNSVVAFPNDYPLPPRSVTATPSSRKANSSINSGFTTPRLHSRTLRGVCGLEGAKPSNINDYRMIAASMKDGTTALMLAAEYNDIGVINDLLHTQARIQDKRGRTALMRATEKGHLEAVAILAPLESRQADAEARTALMYAAKNGHLLCIELLLHAESRCRKRNGWTALMTAIESRAIDAVKLLKQKEEDIVMSDGTTPLMIAAKAGSTACLQEFIADESGKTDEAGFFALLWAVLCNNIPCVSYLLPYELHLVDKNGKSAYHWAKEKKRKECAALIREYCLENRINLS